MENVLYVVTACDYDGIGCDEEKWYIGASYRNAD